MPEQLLIVATSNDDTLVYSAGNFPAWNYARIGRTTVDWHNWLRFPMTIPKDAVVTKAHIDFFAQEEASLTTAGDFTVVINRYDGVHCPSFSSNPWAYSVIL